jgi:uncharacterized protein YjiS (DUF1127 family)
MAALQTRAIVQLQHLPHVSGNSATERCQIRWCNKLRLIEMAYINSSRAASFSLADRISGFVALTKANLARRAVYNQTVRELNTLTDRELADLGIARVDILSVAHEAAYGK